MSKKNFEEFEEVTLGSGKDADFFAQDTRQFYSDLRPSKERRKTSEAMPSTIPDLVVLSHLRWDFVWQRPQHLLSRGARDRRVFFC